LRLNFARENIAINGKRMSAKELALRLPRARFSGLERSLAASKARGNYLDKIQIGF
jgi:hypothetical protein